MALTSWAIYTKLYYTLISKKNASKITIKGDYPHFLLLYSTSDASHLIREMLARINLYLKLDANQIIPYENPFC